MIFHLLLNVLNVYAFFTKNIIDPIHGLCPIKYIPTSQSKCVLLDYLQSSSKSLCTQSEGYMFEGGCSSQCDG